MRVLHVAAEFFPLLKTGGLADVLGALPQALNAQQVDTRVLLPGFPSVCAGVRDVVEVCSIQCFAGSLRLLLGAAPNGVPLYVIDAPVLYSRPGNPYHDAQQHAYADNHLRFALLSWVGAQLANGLDPLWRPDVAHCHDWHAGLMPAYLAQLGRPVPSVFTIHNLAYQGLFDSQCFVALGLPASYFDMCGVEFHGNLSFMKAGIYFADQVTTVSPSYAREITTPEQGCGLEGLLAGRASVLSGLLNGIDESVWNPASDALIAAPYSMRKMAGKAICKQALQAALGLELAEKKLVFAVVSRLAQQKGLPLVQAVLPEIVRRGGQLVLLGSGEPALEAAFRAAAQTSPDQVAVHIGYDEDLAHQVVAGSDVILVPSLYEPCGLTQLYGLQYGTLPLVRRVGGLADTVVDCALENMADQTATGFVFDAPSPEALLVAIRRAFALWAMPRDWRRVQHTAMAQDFGWQQAARRYSALYQRMREQSSV